MNKKILVSTENGEKSCSKSILNFILFYKKHKVIINIMLYLFVMLGIPLILQSNLGGLGDKLKKTIGIGTPRDWLGFWGTYIGTIITIIFAYISTIHEDNKRKQETRKTENKENKKNIDELLKKIDVLVDELYKKAVTGKEIKTAINDLKKERPCARKKVYKKLLSFLKEKNARVDNCYNEISITMPFKKIDILRNYNYYGKLAEINNSITDINLKIDNLSLVVFFDKKITEEEINGLNELIDIFNDLAKNVTTLKRLVKVAKSAKELEILTGN